MPSRSPCVKSFPHNPQPKPEPAGPPAIAIGIMPGSPHPALVEWVRIARQLCDPDVELTVEEFALVVKAYHRMRSADIFIDPMAQALIELIARQAADSDDDGDRDDSDVLLNREDSDADGSSAGFLDGEAEADELFSYEEVPSMQAQK